MNDREQIIRDGYLIRRNMIGKEQLEVLRAGAESMVRELKARVRRNPLPREPEGSYWDFSPQPRTGFEPFMEDPSVARMLEFVLGEQTYEFSNSLFNSARSVPGFFSIFQVLCNAEHMDYGPADWHRDINPVGYPPLDMVFEDLKANGPHYVQWNIALYDDNRLWVVPGSHLRRNTQQENAAVRDHPDRPLPGAVQADLKAGDGVTYIAPILHWGSRYGKDLRRTIHCGYRPSCGKYYRPHNLYVASAISTFEQAKTLPCLPPWALERVDRIQQDWSEERDVVEKVFRAILARDTLVFNALLAQLHPGEIGRMSTVVFLLKFLDKFVNLKKQSTIAGRKFHPESLVLRFSEDELSILQDRFSILDSKLQYDQERHEPLFQGMTSKYCFYERPQGFDVDEFVASWGGGA